MRGRTQHGVATRARMRMLRPVVDGQGRVSGFDATRTAEATPARPETTAPMPAPLQLRDASRYELLGEHGRGGLGRVLRAHDRELGRDIAIKELLERTNT